MPGIVEANGLSPTKSYLIALISDLALENRRFGHFDVEPLYEDYYTIMRSSMNALQGVVTCTQSKFKNLLG